MLEMKIDDLESSGVMRAILFISEMGAVQKIDLRKILGLAAGTSMRIIDILINNRIVEVLPNPEKHQFGLTKKGERIAEKIKELENEL